MSVHSVHISTFFANTPYNMVQMPKIMYGTAWKKERTADLVYAALRAGFRGVDTACQPKHYREDLVGKGIHAFLKEGKVKREELFIQTKYTSIDGQDRSQPLPYDPKAPISQQVEQSISTSLKNLGVDYIDAVVLHSPLRTREKTLEAYRALESFHSRGVIKSLGVSNIYEPEELRWLIGEARVPVKVVQNRWYQGNGWDWETHDVCQAHEIRYQSFWTLTGSPAFLSHPYLVEFADKYKWTPQQAVYKLCTLWNITPLCGSTTPAHVSAALDAVAAENSDISAASNDVEALRKLIGGDGH